jgi:hypothetical protein
MKAKERTAIAAHRMRDCTRRTQKGGRAVRRKGALKMKPGAGCNHSLPGWAGKTQMKAQERT